MTQKMRFPKSKFSCTIIKKARSLIIFYLEKGKGIAMFEISKIKWNNVGGNGNTRLKAWKFLFVFFRSKILLILSWKLEHYDLVQARIWTLSLQTENMAEHFKLNGDKSPLSTYVPSGMHSTCQGLACLI